MPNLVEIIKVYFFNTDVYGDKQVHNPQQSFRSLSNVAQDNSFRYKDAVWIYHETSIDRT